MRGESGQLESLDNTDILEVVSDPLGGVVGPIIGVLSWFCMSLAEVPAVTCLSRVVSFFEMLTNTLRRVYTGPVPRTWPVRDMSLSAVLLSTSWPWSSDTPTSGIEDTHS